MLPKKQIQILRELGRYNFLSRVQMAHLGIEKYNSNFSKYCSPLLKSDFIAVQDAKMAGLGYIYYLTVKGAQYITNNDNPDLQEVNYPKRKPTLDSNIYHRTYAIDCQIELYLSCQNVGSKIIVYHKDIDNSKKNLERKTRISLSPNEHIEPDAIFMLDTTKGRKLYCLEFEYHNTLAKSLAKIKRYIRATNNKAVSRKYEHPKGHRTLFVYHNEKLMNAVIKRLKSQVNNLDTWFLFKSYQEINTPWRLEKSQFFFEDRKDFTRGWRAVSKGEIDLY